MWVFDRTELIVLGIAAGLVVLLGVMSLVAPAEPPAAATSAVPEQTDSQATYVPEEPEPIVVVPQPEPEPEPVPEPAVPGTPLTSAPAVDGVIHTGEYAHATEAGGFRVYWSNDTVVLRIGLFSPGAGYVAIGLDPDRRMQGANFIIGAVRSGRMDIRDDYGTGSLSHGSDIANGGTDDILDSAGRELNGQTTIEFIIPLDSGDRFDKPLEPGETYEVLIAYHNTSDNFSTRHSQRGSGEIRLDDARP